MVNQVNNYKKGIMVAAGVATGVVLVAGLYCYYLRQHNKELVGRVDSLERSNREIRSALEANTAASAQVMGVIENFGKNQAALLTSLAAIDRLLSTQNPPAPAA